MGLGLLGRGIGDAEFLAEAGAELIVTDLKERSGTRAVGRAIEKILECHLPSRRPSAGGF